MKKLLVMLLAVSMVLSMTFALASCGGDEKDTDSSKPDSKVESTEGSTAASSEDAPASSEDSVASSEDSDVPSEDSVASSEDSGESSDEPVSEEPSVDDSSAAPAVDYKVTPTKTNYALNKTYTLTRDTTDTDPAILYLAYSNGDYSWSDADSKKMTDGVVGNITDPEYAGSAVAKPGISVCLQGTNKPFEYIIDLGDYYGDIKSLVFRNVRDGRAYGANRGFKVRIAYVSDDGVNWTKVNGTTTPAAVPGAPEIKSNLDENVVGVQHFDMTFTLNEAAKGKFVRVILTSDDGYVIQLEEIEIWN